MHAGMTGTTNPDALAEIEIIPMMIDQLHGPMSLTQLTALVRRIGSFVFDAPKVLSRSLSDPVLPHVGSSRRSHRLSISCRIFAVHAASTWLAAIRPAIRSFPVEMKLFNRQGLCASIAASGRRWRQAFNQSRTFHRAASPLDFMGWWRQEGLATVGASHLNLAIVPWAVALGKFEGIKMPFLSHTV
jgi:hypothetical protein